VIGDVKLGQNSSVWYGSVLRGDVSLIEIGDDSIIQDLVTLKRASGEGPVRIGRGVTIGPNCYIGGAVVEDYAYIGMGSFIGDGCVVESYAVLQLGQISTLAAECLQDRSGRVVQLNIFVMSQLRKGILLENIMMK
jgi:carbonic anhydrase/acetyltransferase-like protein (isoleucine patch superfamily)